MARAKTRVRSTISLKGFLIDGAFFLCSKKTIAGTTLVKCTVPHIVDGATSSDGDGNSWNYEYEMYLIDGAVFLSSKTAIAGTISVKCTS